MDLYGKFGKAIVYTDDIEQEAISQIVAMLNEPMAEGANVRIMPDVHAGSGCVIGYTAKKTDKIVPNLIGVDIGCFTGDTKIALTDGRDLTFEELVKECNDGKENYCYSIDKDSNIVIGKIENPHQTKISETIYNIELDNGEIIKCTPEHIFFTRDNREIMAKDLSINDSLMPLYLDIAKNIPFNKKSYQNKKNKLEEYRVAYNPNTQKYDYVHFLADNFNIALGLDSKENGGIRHHKDFDKLNNNPNNIKRVGWKEHWIIHQKAVKENNKKGITGFGIARKKHPEFFAKMGSDNMKKLHQDPEFAKRRNIRAAENWKKYNASDKAKEEHKKAGQRGKKYLIEYNKNPPKFECPKCCRIIGGKGNFNKHIKACENHKIISIEIENKQVPVYDLQVPEYNNYALTSGVFVHNCGVTGWKLGKRGKVGEKFDELDKVIRSRIPYGREVREDVDRELLRKLYKTLDIKGMDFNDWEFEVDRICHLMGQDRNRVWSAIGSLGGGNHYLELGEDDNNNLWFTVHSGSRNFGLKIALYHQEIAEKQTLTMPKAKFEIEKAKIEKAFDIAKKNSKGKQIAEAHKLYKSAMSDLYAVSAVRKHKRTGLEYLVGKAAEAYYHDMNIAQIFAQLSRRVMGYEVLKNMYGMDYFNPVESVHNYVNFEDGIVRKGAISAHKDEIVFIPMNMAYGTLLCKGKGNSDFNYSAAHGAGRLMSRRKAKEKIKLEDFQNKMDEAGVWTSCVNESTIDESPQAYKLPENVIKHLEPTVEVISRIIPLYNFKANS